MERPKIDELVTTYQRTRDESVFNEIYEALREKIPKMVRKLAAKYWLDEQEVEWIINGKIFEVVLTHDPLKGTFENILSRAIRCGCIDIVRKKKRTEDKEFLYDDFKEIERQAETIDGETEMIEYIQKKVDQRQLVESMKAKSDDKTRQCLNVFTEENFSYLNAAKRLGTTPKTVRRRIRSLAKHYNLPDDFHDFFTVKTVPISA